ASIMMPWHIDSRGLSLLQTHYRHLHLVAFLCLSLVNTLAFRRPLIRILPLRDVGVGTRTGTRTVVHGLALVVR
ncbi:hypothetical protein GE09DRAFT_1145557, partial [Coniochaeta sp. 2T2.1]